jgi:hypothetical protein
VSQRASLGPAFRRLWTANAFANMGDGIAFVAIPLLAVAFTSDPLLIAGLSVVHSAVRLVVVLPVGGLVDRGIVELFSGSPICPGRSCS